MFLWVLSHIKVSLELSLSFTKGKDRASHLSPSVYCSGSYKKLLSFLHLPLPNFFHTGVRDTVRRSLCMFTDAWKYIYM